MAAFRTFKRSASARDVVRFLDDMEAYPLVEFEPVPRDVVEYVEDHPPGEEPIATILDYADYSRSKLDHYVAEPATLKRVVGGRRTYLSRLDGEPLTVDWPPPDAGTLRYRCRELVSVVGRFAPDLVADVRAVRALADREDYDRLRESAQATAELGAEERRRLESGDVSRELASARERRERLADALEEHPPL
jgi:hypothetical protein